MKHINNNSVETSFFKLITSENKVTKEIINDKPIIMWQEDESTTNSWSYNSGEERDNDFDIINQYRG
jgi:hypothetical protein